MSNAASPLNLSAPRTAARRVEGLATMLLCLLLGLSVQLDIGGASLVLPAGYLLPLVAAWWARRDGLGAVVPLALLCLAPHASVHAGSAWFNYGFSGMAIWPRWVSRSRSLRAMGPARSPRRSARHGECR